MQRANKGVRKHFKASAAACGRRAASLLLSACMMLSMFSGWDVLIPAAHAEEGTGTGASTRATSVNGPTVGVERQADPSTMDTYTDILNLSEDSRAAGRLWSDKSVFANGYVNELNNRGVGDVPALWDGTTLHLDADLDGVDGSVTLDDDFLHVYSVLGSSQELAENVPVDIVIAMDITASMLSSSDLEALNGTTGRQGSTGDGSNLAITLTAVNNLIKQVREYSSASRIGIVVYWGTGYQMIPFVQGNIEFKGYSLHNGQYASSGGTPGAAAIQSVLHYVISDSTTQDDAEEDGTKNGYYVYDPVSGNHFRYDDPGTDYFNAKYMTYSTPIGGNLTIVNGTGGKPVADTGNGHNSDLGGGTNIEAGIYTAMRGVADLGLEKGTEYTLADGTKVKREPIVVVLSDGGTYHTLVKTDDNDDGSDTDWVDNSTTIGGNWWNVSAPQKAAATKYRDGTKEEQSLLFSAGMVADVAAMLQGAYWKAAIANVYGKEDVSSVPVYTIGLDVNSLYIGIANNNSISDGEDGTQKTGGNTVFTSPAALNPKNVFDNHGGVDITNSATQNYSFNQFNEAVKEWKAGTSYDPINIRTDLINNQGGFTTGNPGSLQRQSTNYVFKAPTADNQGSSFSKYGVTPDQIDLIYTNGYYSATGTGGSGSSLANIFDDIFASFTQNIFAPVQGGNDLGVGDAVTYMDPIGKYMEVKDVKNLVLFGENYPITRTAVYDYHWNQTYMSQEGRDPEKPLEAGWYKGDAASAVYSPAPNAGYGTKEAAWADGWVYRISYSDASRFVPTLKDIRDDSTPSEVLEKMRNTVYTFYRIDNENIGEEGKPENFRYQLHINPAYLDPLASDETFDKGNDTKEQEIIQKKAKQAGVKDELKYDEDGGHQKVPGVFALADLRIWVEDTGDYNDTAATAGGLENDTNFDQALWVNVPVNMLPLRRVTINKDSDGTLTYIDNQSDADPVRQSASFPLRVFYTVGMSDDVTKASGRIDIAGAVNANYIQQNKAEDQTEAIGRKVTQGDVEFFSNWYNHLQRYDMYATDSTAYTYGDPVVTFSPAANNRYYIFSKALPLYSTAYQYVDDGEGKGHWEEFDREPETFDNKDMSPTDFGGRLLATLDAGTVDDGDDSETKIKKLEEALGVTPKPGDIVLLEDEILDNVTYTVEQEKWDDEQKNNKQSDPFNSKDYFYLAIEYYENQGDTAVPTQYVITRRSNEFGSAYSAVGIQNGDMLCWHDVSGTYSQDYPYISRTEAGDPSRGRDFIGWPLDGNGDYVDAEPGKLPVVNTADEAEVQEAYKSALEKAGNPEGFDPNWKTQHEKVLNEEGDREGEWVVSAKPGGLRVGAMAQSVERKGDGVGYIDLKDDFQERIEDGTLTGFTSGQEALEHYLAHRYPGVDSAEVNSKTWGFYTNNITHTANNYYLPTVSTSSVASEDDIILNAYLGNNGRLLVPDTTLLVSKMVEQPEGADTGESEEGTDKPKEEFQYQLFIDDPDIGANPDVPYMISAVVVRWNKDFGSWLRQFHYIDLELNAQRFLQNQDGSKATVTQGGQECYVYIPRIGETEESIGASANGFRVYHNNDVDELGSVDQNVVKQTVQENGSVEFALVTAWLVPTNVYDSTWQEPSFDPNGDEFKPGEHGAIEYNPEQFDREPGSGFPLLTLDPSVSADTSELSINTPYLVSSSYWTKTVYFGYKEGAIKLNEDGSIDHDNSTPLTDADLYDKIIPSTDAADTFGGLTLSEIAKRTAEFTLKDGEALLFSGIRNGTAYRVTEKLSNEQQAKGYTLKELRHNQRDGTVSTYRPGIQMLPVYYADNSTYGTYGGGAYPAAYNDTPTENGLMWNVNKSGAANPGTVHYEPFQHTNAVMWEYYSTTADAKAVGNHHQPNSVEESTFYHWNESTNKYDETNETYTVSANPSCKPLEEGGCDEAITDEGNNVVGYKHYMFKDGEMLDQHYEGEASGYIRNSYRQLVYPTVHFAVEGETQAMADLPMPGVKPSAAYTGVYSAFGTTSTFEKSANFINTVSNDKTEVTINGNPVAPADGDNDINTYPGVQAGNEITYNIDWSTATDAHVVIIDPLDKGVDFKEAGYVDGTPEGNEAKYFETAADANQYLKEVVYQGDANPYQLEENSGRVVIWDLGVQPQNPGSGKVYLTVTVNENAPEWWDYDGDGVADAPASPMAEDHLVRDRATVRVADNTYFTNTVVNPLGEPDKTETGIDADGNTVTVKESGDDANLKLDEDDGKWHGPLVFEDNTITYTIEWRNYQNVPATVSIRDPLDKNVSFVSASFNPDEDFYDKDSTDDTPKHLTGIGYGPDGSGVLQPSVEGKQEISGSKTATDKKVGGYVDAAGKAEDDRTVIVYDSTKQVTDADGNVISNGTVTWNLGVMPAGSYGKVTLQVTVDKGAIEARYVDNTAYVTVGNDAEMQTKTVENPTNEQHKTETKPGEGQPVSIGQEIVYEIDYYNYRNTEATVFVMDTLDIGVDYVGSAKYVPGDEGTEGTFAEDGDYYPEGGSIPWGDEGTDDDIEVPARTVVWQLEKVPGNSGGKVQLTVKTNENARVTWDYNGEATGGAAGSGTGEDDRVVNQARVRVENDNWQLTEKPANPVPEDHKTETKPGDGKNVKVNDTVSYEIKWSNNHEVGEPNADVWVFDTLDPGVDYVVGSATYDDNDPDTPDVFHYYAESEKVTIGEAPNAKTIDVPARTLVWHFENTESGAEGTLTFDVTVNETAFKSWDYGTGYDTDAWTSPATGTADDNRIINQARVKVGNDNWVLTEDPQNPLVEKTETAPGDGRVVGVGDEIEYAITYANTTDEPQDIYVFDKLDPGVVCAAGGISTGGTYYAAGTTLPTKDGDIAVPAHTVVWQIENVQPGTGGKVTLKVTVTADAEKTWDYNDLASDGNAGAGTDDRVVNQARVKVGNGDWVITQKPTNPVPDDHKTETDPGDRELVKVGDTVKYSIKWSNYKDAEADVLVFDTLDPGVDYTEGTAQPAANFKDYFANGGEVTIGEGTNARTVDVPARTLVWYIRAGARATGNVTFDVTVNDKAVKSWDYTGQDGKKYDDNAWQPKPAGTGNDDLIINQARVKVDDDSWYLTEDPQNPLVWKTENDPGAGKHVEVGQQVDYTIHWANDALEDATGEPYHILVEDILDEGVDFVSASCGEVTLTAENVKAGNTSSYGGDVSIGYTADPATGMRTVTWDITTYKKDAAGDVKLSVKVNDKARQVWYYDDSNENAYVGQTGEGTDDLIHNQARIVANRNNVKTERIDNPVWQPEKNETAINGSELPADKFTVKLKGKDGDVSTKQGPLVHTDDIVTYQVTWKNYKKEQASVTVTDALDKGVEYVPNTAAAYRQTTVTDEHGQTSVKMEDCGTGTYDATTHTITWELGKQKPGAEGIVVFQVKVLPAADDYWNDYYTETETPAKDNLIRNRAGVEIEGDPRQYTDVVENPVGQTPKKEEVTPGEGERVNVGDIILYTIEWTNNEGEPATVKVTDQLDNGVDFVGAKFGEPTPEEQAYTSPDQFNNTDTWQTPSTFQTALSEGSISYDEDARTVTWELKGEQAPGVSGKVTLAVQVNADASVYWDYAEDNGIIDPGFTFPDYPDNVVRNQARVTVNDSTVTTNKVENPVWEPRKVETTPGDGNMVEVGEEIIYRVSWKNYKDTVAKLTVRDKLDPGVDYKPGTAKAYIVVTSGDPNGDYITDGMVPGLNYKQMDVTGQYDEAKHSITWELGTQESGAEGYVEFVGIPNEKAIKEWSYEAPEKDVGTEDDHIVYNKASVEIDNDGEMWTNVVENPLPEKKEATPGENVGVKVGDTVTYDIYWKNNAKDENGKPGKATVIVTDKLDPGVDFVSASFGDTTFANGSTTNSVPGVSISYASDTHTVTWTLTDREPESEGTVHLEIRVNEDARLAWDYGTGPDGSDTNEPDTEAAPDGVIHNKAQVQVGNDAAYTSKVDNPVWMPEKTEPKPGDGKQVEVGQEITYEVTWKNYHDTDATVVVTDKLDPGVDYVDGSAQAFDVKGDVITSAVDMDDKAIDPIASYDAASHTVTWNLGKQAPDAEGHVTFKVKVNANARSYWNGYVTPQPDPVPETDFEVLNQAGVKVGDDPEIKTNILENPVPEKTETKIDHADETLKDEDPPELVPSEDENNTLTGPLVYVGDEITYKIYWKNGHSDPADVIITDPLDTGVDFVEADNGGDYNEDTHTVTWSLPGRAAGADGWVTLIVRVNEKATPVGYVQNQAAVKVGSDDAVMTKVIENPTPKVEKVEVTPGEGDTVEPGKQIDYTISWHNYEEEPADVIITDKLDPGVDFVSATFDGIALEAGNEAPKPKTANLTLLLNGEGADPFTFTLALTVPEGKELAADGYGWRNGESAGTWTETANTLTLKPGDALTVYDLPVGTRYTLTAENGDTVITDQAVGTYGSALTVEVTQEVSTVALDATPAPTATPEPAEEPAPTATPEPTEEPAPTATPEPTEEPAPTATPEPTEEPAPTATPESTEEPTPTVTPEPTVAPAPAAVIASAAELPAMPRPKPSPDVDTENDVGTEEGTPDGAGTDGDTQTIVTYTFTAVAEDLPAPEEADEPMPLALEGDGSGDYTLDGEKPALEVTNQDANIDIFYFDKAHTVVWVLKNREPNAKGTVGLSVRVNDDANKFWSYDDPDLGPAGDRNDDRVRNQAGVKVGNNPEVKTRVIENPTKPEKTETHINDTDVSRDLVVEETSGDYTGPKVHVGDTITYRITWQNNAVDTNKQPVAAQITITDVLDPGVDFVDASDKGSYDAGTRTVTWDLVQPARASGSVTLTVKVNANALEDEKEVVNQATVTVGDNSQVTNRVENPVEEVGALTVSKTVTGDAGDKTKDWHFRVELSDKTISGTYGDMTFTEGVAEFTLKHGESATAQNLPAGITYTVTETEANADGYATQANGASGTIPAGDTAKATFENRKDPEPTPPPTPTPPPEATPTPAPAPTPTPTVVIPRTSDDAPLGLWLGLLIVSALGLILTVLIYKSSKGRKERKKQ